jgi:hypothetical protein
VYYIRVTFGTGTGTGSTLKRVLHTWDFWDGNGNGNGEHAKACTTYVGLLGRTLTYVHLVLLLTNNADFWAFSALTLDFFVSDIIFT